MCTAKQQGESDSPPRVTCAYRCNARLTVDACMELQILLLGPYHFPYIVYHTSYYNTSPLSWNHASHGHLSLSTFYHTLLSLLGTSLVAAACAFRAHRLVHRYYPCYKEHCKITSASLPSIFSFSVFPNFHVADNLPVCTHSSIHDLYYVAIYLNICACIHPTCTTGET
jgi:hypothetical protein